MDTGLRTVGIGAGLVPNAAAGIIARQAQLESLQGALAKGNDEAVAVEVSLSDLLTARGHWKNHCPKLSRVCSN
jgi:hypothetical protein